MAGMPGIIIKVGTDARSAIQGLNKVNRALGVTQTRGEKFASTMTRLGPIIATAGAAAGAAAVAFGVDAAKAFIEDQKQVDLLNKQLSNLGLDEATKQIEDFVSALQLSANVSDTDVRSAFQTLIRGTRNVEEAQKATTLAFDIAALTGRDVTSIAQAMSAGYMGNTQALGRLKIGLDKATLASGDMEKITKILQDRMGGGAQAKADTLSGAIEGVQQQWDELRESFGKGLVLGGAEGTDDPVASLKETEAQLKENQKAAETLGIVANRALGFAAGGINRFAKAVDVTSQKDVLGFSQAVMSVFTLGASENAGWSNRLTEEADGVTSAFDIARRAVERYLRVTGQLGVAASPNNTVDGWMAALYGPRSGSKAQRNPNRIGIENDRRRAQRRREALAAARERARQNRRAQARSGINFGADSKGVRPW